MSLDLARFRRGALRGTSSALVRRRVMLALAVAAWVGGGLFTASASHAQAPHAQAPSTCSRAWQGWTEITLVDTVPAPRTARSKYELGETAKWELAGSEWSYSNISDYQVVDHTTGQVVMVPRNPNDDNTGGVDYTSWTPPHLGAYDVSVTFDDDECPGAGLPPVHRTAVTVTASFDVVPLLLGRPQFRWAPATGVCPPFAHGCPPGTAFLVSNAPCEYSAAQVTLTLRYTLNGRRPGPKSAGWQRTTSCTGDGPKRPAVRHGRAWVVMAGAGQGGGLAFAKPGARLRVWMEWRSRTEVLGAVRARARTRNGKVSWVPDGHCDQPARGCTPLRSARRPRANH